MASPVTAIGITSMTAARVARGDAAAPAIGGDAAAPKKIMGPSAWKPLSDYPEPPPLPAKFKELMWQAYSVHPKSDFHAAFI